MINTATQLCAVIGNPVEHSLSPAIHNAAFQALGLNYVYVAFRVEDVKACLTGMRALESFRGLSVTIPHKMTAMAHVDEVDAMAQQVGCINTVTNEDGKLVGSITDGLGTLRAFQEAGVDLQGKKVLFVGSGGAVRAVAFAMAGPGQVAQVTILGRTPSRVMDIINDLRGYADIPIHDGSLADDMERAMAEADVVIQGTPIGMYPNSIGQSAVPRELLRPEQVVFDMVYRPLKTKFIEDAEAVGCPCILGTEMLLNQAALQFECWTGQAAPLVVMREALLAQLG